MAIRGALRSGYIKVAVFVVARFKGVIAIPIRGGPTYSEGLWLGLLEGTGHGYSKGLAMAIRRDWPYLFDWSGLLTGYGY